MDNEVQKSESDLPEIEKEIESGIEDQLETPDSKTEQPIPEASQNLKDTPPGKDDGDSHRNPNLLKYLVILLLFIVTVAFIGTEFYLMVSKSKTPEVNQTAQVQTPTPTPDPTADWKISNSQTNLGWNKYSNSKNNLVFELPSYWKITSSKLGPEVVYINATNNNSNITIRTGEGGYGSEYLEKERTIPVKMNGENINAEILKSVSPEDLQISIAPTDSRVLHALGSTSTLDIFSSYNGTTKSLTELVQILSTFKFTDATSQSSTDTSSWKTYTSTSEPSLSFKYPPTWSMKKSSGVYSDGKNETVELTSANGTKITYSAGGNNFGGACGDENVKAMINNVIPLTHAKGLYYINATSAVGKDGSTRKEIGIMNGLPKVGPISTCSLHLIFYSKSDPSKQIIFTVLDNLNPKDEMEAKQILQSLTY